VSTVPRHLRQVPEKGLQGCLRKRFALRALPTQYTCGAARKDQLILLAKDHALFERYGHSQQVRRGVKSLESSALSEQFKNALFQNDDYSATDYE
jgi:hypothetical protein